jgi:hypothetical protein
MIARLMIDKLFLIINLIYNPSYFFLCKNKKINQYQFNMN